MNNYQEAIQAWKDQIGTNKVESSTTQTEKYAQNITEYEADPPVAVLKPENRSDVEAIVAVANKYHVPIYVVSTNSFISST